MKKMRKLLSLALVLVMVLGLSTAAFAADDGTYTVTVNNAEGHSYVIYQIFTGDLSGEAPNEVLANLKYGKDYGTEGQKVPEDVLKNLKSNATSIVPTGNGTPMDPVDGVPTATGLVAGYYMIKDVTTNLPAGEAPSAVIFQVVGNTAVASKHPTTTIEKKVQDINDSTGVYTEDSTRTEGETTWIDSADYDIGDTVPFKSTAKFEGLDNYTSYKVVFTDTMAKGLTYTDGSMKVYVNGDEKTSSFTISTATCTDNEGAYVGGTVITVTCNDIKALTADENGNTANAAEIVLEYSAKLNENANIGEAGNPNKIKVTTKPDGTGETPEDVNIVFTFKTDVNKVDPELKPLTGAEFKLEKFEASETGTVTYKKVKGEWVEKVLVKNEDGTTFSFKGLDDGEYRITETQTPDGYNSVDPIYFTVTATHDVVSSNPGLTKLEASQSETDKAAGSIATFTASTDNSTVSTNVVNNRGVELPETGGIGTTIFYIVGGILVLGAVVLLVTKKRMSAEA